MSELLQQLEAVFSDVFGRDVPLTETMSAKDIGDWAIAPALHGKAAARTRRIALRAMAALRRPN